MSDPQNPYRPLPPDFLNELFRDPLDPGYAAAAKAREARGGARPVGWRGLRGVTLVTLLVVGLLLAVAYRQVVAEEPTRSQVRADLQEQVRHRQSEAEQLRAQVDELREQVAQLRDEQLDDPAVVRQLRALEAATGLARVSGDGVVVRVGDGPAELDPVTGEQVTDPQARIIDQDLQQIVNALWAAGAEAVAVNGRRLTATSTIRSASGAILVDRQPVGSPYEVAAIGPADLKDGFEATPAAALMRLLVDEYGVEYQVRTEDGLTLPAAAEPQLYHATPVTD